MDAEEKAVWIFSLWALSLGATAWLFGSIFSGWEADGWAGSVAMLFPMVFVATLMAWLFRLTYVLGRNS